MDKDDPQPSNASDGQLVAIAARVNLAACNSAGLAGYIDGAHHLKNETLRMLYAGLLVEVFQGARRRITYPRVLDLGADEGGGDVAHA